jgi:hypothetical protein
MKIPLPQEAGSWKLEANLQPSTFNLQPSRRRRAGMALIITLILLSVTLIMAVAFLAIARRERNAVSTTTDTAVARLATDSALAAAEAQLAANVFATTNQGAYDYHLLVSTNYINPVGYVPGSQSPTNVNYDITSDNSPYTAADLEQNIANLWLLPRAPVFVSTNNGPGYDFRFWLDLNQNHRFEGNGPQPQIDAAGLYIHTDGTADSSTSVKVATNFMVGDPEWIGVLERPDQPHSANNHFVARYAFIAQPIGNSLDLNYIHNQAITKTVNPAAAGQDGFFRNQGVGSWELNLAAFLTDLNTNEWDTVSAPYNYSRWFNNNNNNGAAFDDARSLLSWRYQFDYRNLATAEQVFGNTPFNDAATVFPNDAMDGYSDGPLQTTLNTNADVPLPFAGGDSVSSTTHWVGADNTNHFFSLPSDLFDTSKITAPSFNFIDRLRNAGGGQSTYDRYTYYRLFDQLGTGSTADSGKLNLNYSNAVVGYNSLGVVTNIAIVPGAETNLVSWSATNFFHAAANQMLGAYTKAWFQANPPSYLFTYYGFANNGGNLPGSPGYFYYLDNFGNTNIYDRNGFGLTNVPLYGLTNQIPAFGVTNIPVYVNGQFVYAPAVNRLLQLAANIYDAGNTNWYPAVFRPVFSRLNTNVFVTDFNQVSSVSGVGDIQLSTPFDPSYFAAVGGQNVAVNLYGVPWIIGAKIAITSGLKTGFPAFNQFSLVNAVTFERLLEVTRNVDSGAVLTTNQQLTMNVGCNEGVSFWNSYSNNYTGSGNLQIYMTNTVQMWLTNSKSATLPEQFGTWFYYQTNRWPGSKWSGTPPLATPDQKSFISGVWSNTMVSSQWQAYNFVTNGFSYDKDNCWDSTLSPLPQFGLAVTNWVQAYILDGPPGACHVIDYVQLFGPAGGGNLNSVLKDPDGKGAQNPYYLWITNNFNNVWPSWGIMDQLQISSQPVTLPATAKWNSQMYGAPSAQNITKQRAILYAALNGQTNYAYNGGTYPLTEPVVQAGYTALRAVFVPYLYQVNDPLVHCLASDLDAGAGANWAGNNVIPNGVWQPQNKNTTYTFPTAPGYNEFAKSRYQPWGRVAPTAVNNNNYNFGNAYNAIYKDPLVWGPDGWNFPTNRYPTVGWLGRVHRGSPWQTVYLKDRDVLTDNTAGNLQRGTNTWAAWTGDNNNYFDAGNSAPVQDRLLFELFTTRFNDNAVRGTLSVNQKNLAAWSAVFSGLVVPTSLTNSYTVISPAGAAGLSDPMLGALVTGITNAQKNSGVFTHVGDILNASVLTGTNSPFLAGLNPNTQISDALSEWLPQQTLGLLRVGDTPRFVVYCFGQTLKPARDALVLDNNAGQFGLCTNYQVTAESAARAVIRLERHITATGTNYTPVVESYNPLPPN